MVARKGTGINLGEGAVKVFALPNIDVTPINSYVALVIGGGAPGSKLGFAARFSVTRHTRYIRGIHGTLR